MNERLAEALSYVSDRHIAEAAAVKRRHRNTWFRVVAAVLVVVILFNLPHIPSVVMAKEVSAAASTRAMERPDYDKYKNRDNYWADVEAYRVWQQEQETMTVSTLDSLSPFFADSTLLYMEGVQDNRVWSPVNGFIALAMLAEVTDGNSRQQILDALQAADLDNLRRQVEVIWESAYYESDHSVCSLANSLWIDKGLTYNQEAMDALAYYHYASIYQVDLQSGRAGRALQTWLNNNTGGLLKDYTANASFPPEAVLTLASTVYLQAKWVDEFRSVNNTEGFFHAPGGDRRVTFMNKKLAQMHYYWGDSFGAVNLSLKNGTRMWFFLPDEGKTVEDVLSSTQYLQYLSSGYESEEEYYKYMKVNLSVPKFDISSGADLTAMFRALGITDVFDLNTSDFTAITADTPVFIASVNQAARVIIDEQGVKAAAYIEIPGAGAAMPPEEIIDFILDRPFLFVIASTEGVPLFTGVVNKP